jgi:hypothetical protein
MANEEHLKILRQGIEVWNKWREANRDIQPDLSGANLHGANLDGADLGHLNLRGTILRGAYLKGAILSFTDLLTANREPRRTGNKLSIRDTAICMDRKALLAVRCTFRVPGGKSVEAQVRPCCAEDCSKPSHFSLRRNAQVLQGF